MKSGRTRIPSNVSLLVNSVTGEKIEIDSLEKRIHEAKNALDQYPDWVKANAYFQGGENLRRDDSEK